MAVSDVFLIHGYVGVGRFVVGGLEGEENVIIFPTASLFALRMIFSHGRMGSE